MKLYRNIDMTGVGQWVGTQDHAQKDFGRGQWKAVEVPTDKPGLIAWLNALDRAVTGIAANDVQTSSAPLPAMPLAPRYAETTIALDEAWQALPLARKLHFAALAMEDARDLVPHT